MSAPFFRDLNPYAGGKITYKDLGDKWVMSWEDVPLYWPRDKKETFQVILNVDGSIIFQYKDLQHVDSYVKAEIEDEQGKEGIGISQTSLAKGKAYEIVRVVNKIESPPAEKVTITSKTSYAYGNGQLCIRVEENPLGSPAKPYYYHNDHLGSARVITDKDGKVVEQIFYYPFGGGGAVGGPTFTGKKLYEGSDDSWSGVKKQGDVWRTKILRQKPLKQRYFVDKRRHQKSVYPLFERKQGDFLVESDTRNLDTRFCGGT
ncbi:MAG: hypothetical protein AB1414_15640 [bacterium]